MQIKMLTGYDNGTIVLAKGDDGEGLSAAQKRRFVKAGLAEEVGAKRTAARSKPPATRTPKQGSAAKSNTRRRIKPADAERLASPAPAPAGQAGT